jgi:hypothetical protein
LFIVVVSFVFCTPNNKTHEWQLLCKLLACPLSAAAACQACPHTMTDHSCYTQAQGFQLFQGHICPSH